MCERVAGERDGVRGAHTVRCRARRRSPMRLHRKSSSGDGSAACRPRFRALAFGFYAATYAFCFMVLCTLSDFGFRALAFGLQVSVS